MRIHELELVCQHCGQVLVVAASDSTCMDLPVCKRCSFGHWRVRREHVEDVDDVVPDQDAGREDLVDEAGDGAPG